MSTVCWQPSEDRRKNANMAAFLRAAGAAADETFENYASLHGWSLREPEAFWRTVWDHCGVLGTPGTRTLLNGDQMPGAQWFPDARLNFAENLLRYRDDHPALIFRSETGAECSLDYAGLYRLVARTAAGLQSCGVGPGDRVAGFMPNLPETVVAMLATSAIGATWSSCSPDFGTQGVVDRFGQIQPRVLFCTDAYQYNGKRHDCLQRVRDIAAAIPSIERIVVVPYLDDEADTGGIDTAVDFAGFTDHDVSEVAFSPLPFDHPLYILFSSGTTGVPKCITHGAGGTLLQHLKELVLHTDVKRDDRVFYFTTCGWMMWNWLVSNLAVGATVVLYEGSPFHPEPGALFDLAEQHQVSILGTGAKMISAWQKAGLKPRETHDLGALRSILSTGSPLAPESFDYVYRDVAEDVCLASISGGTDIVSCFVLGCPLLPVHRGEIQCAGLGMDVRILRDDGSEADVGEAGELCCAQPFPSMPVGFWGDHDGSRYKAAYFEQYPDTWAHGDYAKRTEHGGFVIFGRSDATLNPGGVRIGTAEIYRQVEKLDEVLESVCVGQDWDNDVRVILFVRLREGIELDDKLKRKIAATIRDNTTPRHVPAKILQVNDIPRTVSGKIVELAVRNVIHDRKVRNVDALANPEALELYRDLPDLQS